MAIIDPGPEGDQHFEALVRAINGRKLIAILLTHTHKDHSAMAKRIAKHYGAPIWFEGKHRLSRPKRLLEVNLLHKACDWDLPPDQELADGQTIDINGTILEIVATPGHCANHICFGIVGEKYLFSGDHVMGWNSTLVANPDGSLDDYFNSLHRLTEKNWSHFLPGHGGEIADLGAKNNAKTFTKELLRHREGRNSQILQLLDNGTNNVQNIVDTIYPEAKAKIRIAAMMTIMAHVEYLEKADRIIVKRGVFGTKIFSA